MVGLHQRGLLEAVFCELVMFVVFPVKNGGHTRGKNICNEALTQR